MKRRRGTTCGGSGAISPAPAGSRSSIAAGTAACWSSASKDSRPKTSDRRGYGEINYFEEQLVAHGILLVKFWMHITKDEQLRRFRDREAHRVQALEDHAPRTGAIAAAGPTTRWR